MSQQTPTLEGGALEAGAVEKQIIAEIIGGYEQWKAEQLALEGGKHHRRGRRGGMSGGEAADLEGGETQLEGGELQGGEDFEGGKKCKSRRTVKLSCGKSKRRFSCTLKRKSTTSKRRSKSKSKRSKRSRKMSPWMRKVLACSRKTGMSPKDAMKKMKGKRACPM